MDSAAHTPPSASADPNGGKRWWALAVSVVVLGVVVGCSSGILSLFLEAVQRTLLGFEESAGVPGPSAVAPWRRIVSLGVGGAVVAVVWWLLRNRARRVPSVKEAVAGAPMPWWQTIVHVVTQMFFVGAGASIGREVAPREAGSMIAQVWMRYVSRFGLRRSDGALMAAAAAGAGFAGVYISPLTGMFFSVEILLRCIDLETVSVSLGMSAIATLVGGAIKGTEPYYSVGSADFMPQLMLVAVVASPLIGFVGAVFRRLTQWAETRKTTGIHIVWQLPAVALLTGVAAVWAPQLTGNGRALAQVAFEVTVGKGVGSGVGVGVGAGADAGAGTVVGSDMEIAALVGLLLVWAFAKGLLTLLTIRSGASGGTLTPSISMGACLGAVIGLVVAMIVPAAGIPIWQCAMVGAVALLTASQQAPLMAMMMLVEITHLPVTALVPLGVAAALSAAVSQRVLATWSKRQLERSK